MKKLKYIILLFLILIITSIFICNRIIAKSTNNLIYNNVTEIPHNRVGLLLGTSQYLNNGQPNQYFSHRIKATVALYNAGKIDYIVASGDNISEGDNECVEMKNELLTHGIPEDIIYLDYAGIRTYDSVIRMNEIFGQTDFTIISQRFHNQRAIYIANRLGLQAVGFNATDVDTYNGFKTNLREKFSRVKVFIDFWTGKKPRFFGETIEIK